MGSAVKLLLTVLVYRQRQYAARIAQAIAAQTTKPDAVRVMLDRPEGIDIVEVRKAFASVPGCTVVPVMGTPEYLGRPQTRPGVDQFCAGPLRNRACSYAVAEGFDAVVFIDGDCIPGTDLVKEYAAVLDTESPRTAVGKRLEVKHGFRDQRECPDVMPVPIFKDVPARVTEEPFFADSGVVWTCNFGMNAAAIRHISDINSLLFGRSEVFSSDFAGTWGGEDGYLGLQCLYTGAEVYAIPSRDAGVLHIEHPRPLDKYDHSRFLEYQDERRLELLHLLTVHGLGTCGHQIRTLPDIVGDRPWVHRESGSSKNT